MHRLAGRRRRNDSGLQSCWCLVAFLRRLANRQREGARAKNDCSHHYGSNFHLFTTPPIPTYTDRATLQVITNALTPSRLKDFMSNELKEVTANPVKFITPSGNVAEDLRWWVRQHTRHRAFIFSYASDPRTAFDKECEDFDDFGGTERLHNTEHPQRPAKTNWLCPPVRLFRVKLIDSFHTVAPPG